MKEKRKRSEDLLIEKHILDEGAKLNMVLDTLSRNLDTILKTIEKGSSSVSALAARVLLHLAILRWKNV